MQGKKVLVTGGAGFIGSHVANALLNRGDQVVIIDNFNDYYNPEIKHARISQLKKKKGLTVYAGDISNYKILAKIFDKYKFDKICHLAAQAGVRHSLKDPFRYESWNNLGTLNLLDLSKKHKIKDFILASSSSVYGGNKKMPSSEKDDVSSPISLYAATKKCNELYGKVYNHLYNMNCTCLRFFSVYGPWGRPDMALFKFVKAMESNKPIDVYNYGKMQRDFTYILDIVSGVVKALDKPFKYEIFNLGNHKTIKLTYLIELIEKYLGKKAKKNLLPMQPGDVPKSFADNSKAKRLLKWKPTTSIEEGTRNFIGWYKNEGNRYNTLL